MSGPSRGSSDASCTCAFHPELTNWHLPSCPLAVAAEPPVLLTDDAAQAAGDVLERSHPHFVISRGFASDVLAAALRHHATEGREALVKRVREAISASYGCAIPRDVAEAVVTALVGAPDA